MDLRQRPKLDSTISRVRAVNGASEVARPALKRIVTDTVAVVGIRYTPGICGDKWLDPGSAAPILLASVKECHDRAQGCERRLFDPVAGIAEHFFERDRFALRRRP
jgi:hypothetical protein